MLSQTWATSPRRYGVVHHEHVAIPVRAGFTLDSEVFRPDAPGSYPVILGAHPYSQADQIAPMMPIGQGGARGHIEMGDYNFYVRRGYAQVVLNLRGTGRSGGLFDHVGRGTIEDLYDAIEWLAMQPWCDGNVGMLGLSYFSIVQKRVAALNPPHLKALFCPYGATDLFRDWHYHGGILSFGQFARWVFKPDGMRVDPRHARDALGDEEYERRLDKARRDNALAAVPAFAQALAAPEAGRNPFILAIVLNDVWNAYFEERALPPDAHVETPAYLGSCWGVYGLHLPGDVRSWTQFAGPKKLTIGPPVYLDRPFYQYQSESLRWFDHWLKGHDTGLLGRAARARVHRRRRPMAVGGRHGRCRRRVGKSSTCTRTGFCRSTSPGRTRRIRRSAIRPSRAKASPSRRRRCWRRPRCAGRWSSTSTARRPARRSSGS